MHDAVDILDALQGAGTRWRLPYRDSRFAARARRKRVVAYVVSSRYRPYRVTGLLASSPHRRPDFPITGWAAIIGLILCGVMNLLTFHTSQDAAHTRARHGCRCDGQAVMTVYIKVLAGQRLFTTLTGVYREPISAHYYHTIPRI